jgi:hypothetical protein
MKPMLHYINYTVTVHRKNIVASIVFQGLLLITRNVEMYFLMRSCKLKTYFLFSEGNVCDSLKYSLIRKVESKFLVVTD